MAPSFEFDQLSAAALAMAESCDHADVRVVRTRTAYQTRRDHSARADIDSNELSLGVRVLHRGCWGFAATDDLSTDAAIHAARQAIELSEATAAVVDQPVELAPEPTYQGTWRSDYALDPFELSAAQRMEFLRWGCERLLAAAQIHHVDATVTAVREETHYADTHGTTIEQQRTRLHAIFMATQVDAAGGFTHLSTIAPPVARGWEFLTEPNGGWGWEEELADLPEALATKAAAPSVQPGRYTLVLHPSNLWLTIHESIAHATELDRIKGYEANYAGTSFVTEADIGSLQYGSTLMNVQADRTTPHGLATVAWDDEGVAAQEWPLITDGVLVGMQLDRAMAAAADLPRSNGCAYAESGSHIQLQRMPNISLQPQAGGGNISDLIAGVEDGIYIVGDDSWSIDMQRYNFQFTGQQFHRIKSGRLMGQLQDVAYQGRTPDFWKSLVAVGGEETVELGGTLRCGKGQPAQSAPVSHGSPAAVFADVNVLNSRQESGS